MANYLYRAVIYKSTTKVINPDPNNEANMTDFEANYKGTAMAITGMDILDTTFISDILYSVFKTKIDGVIITWANVKYIENDICYIINLINPNPL